MSGNGYHKRNPIKRHGEVPSDRFVMVPNDVARDPELTSRGARVLLVLLSHADGWEVSQRSLSEDLRCKRSVIDGALQDLVKAQYLAVTRYQKHNGQRAYETYHVSVNGKFTAAEAAEYNRTIVLPAPKEDQPLAPDEGHPLAPFEGHKEDHLEHQVEEKQEHQAAQSDVPAPDCESCATNPCGVCGIHFHTHPHLWHEPVESSREADTAPCDPSSMPDTMETYENRCHSVGCGTDPIPNGRYCAGHLHLIAASV